MSNTGNAKKLASFNCDQKMWEQFIARCQSQDTTATATLTKFIQLYLDDSVHHLDAKILDQGKAAIVHPPEVITIDNLDQDLLDSMIKAIVEEYLDKSLAASHNYSATAQSISVISSRLEQIELQIKGESNSSETPSSNYLNDLEQKMAAMTARTTQLAEAIMKIQNYLNNQPKRQNKSYSNNSYYQSSTPRIKPLTQEGLASRLGVNPETVSEQRTKLPPPLFVAWSKGKDSSGIGWEFHESTGLYHPAS